MAQERPKKKQIVMKGRAGKRRAFFERHTGTVAQGLALVAVLFAACMLVFNTCSRQGKQDASAAITQPAAAPPAMAISGPEYEPGPKQAPEPEQTPEPEPEEAPPPQFLPEQLQGMDAMLAAWAEQPTLIDRRERDENGNPIGEENLVESGGHNVAVWFYDIETGAEYAYNAGNSFIYASLMKAPYALYLYQLADAGACDLNELVTVEPALLAGYEENSGILKSMGLPRDYSVETLIAFMLQHSDTVALRALLQKYPADGFKTWAEERGMADPQALSTILSGRISAGELGALMLEIVRYIETGPNGGQLRQNMSGDGGYRLIASSHPLIHKYGWDENAYHDMAAVYAPHPYILVILTDKWGGSGEERQTFINIAARMEAEMDALRAAGGL